MATAEKCPICAGTPTLTCSGCWDVMYCSVECRETDWPAHRRLCKTLSQVKSDSSESKEWRRVLYFPPNAERPQLMLLPVHNEHDQTTSTLLCQQPKMSELMGSDWPNYHTIDKNAITQERLPYHIHVCYNAGMVADGEDTNEDDDFSGGQGLIPSLNGECDDEHDEALVKSMDSLSAAENTGADSVNMAVVKATQGLPVYPWRGPIFAFCGKPEDDHGVQDPDIVEVLDMSLAAYSHVVAHLIGYENDSERHRAMLGPKIDAVKVLGDEKVQATSSGSRFITIKLPRFHPLVHVADSEVSQISLHAGIPLVFTRSKNTRQGPNGTAGEMSASLYYVDNHRTSEGDMSYWEPSRSWNDAGTVVVFREGFESLDAETLESFSSFCKIACAGNDEKGGNTSDVSPRSWQTHLAQCKSDTGVTDNA